MVIFPALFGSNELPILASELLGWPGGVAPAGIPQALRHELQRRPLGQVDVAERLGVSCSQFANILQGRFGTSLAVAGRIRDFLIEGAKTVGISVGETAALASDPQVNKTPLAGTDANSRLAQII